jgi:hypothetical protein
MPFNSNITPGRPPLLWSDVQEAFVKVNENFDILVATVGDGSGLTPIDFSSLDTDVSPTTDNLRSLGSITNRWKAVYASEHTLADPTNGVFLGNAQIKGLGFTVNLPENSTIGGDPLTGIGTSLIIDPDKTFFKEIQVDNNLSVVATSFGDTVNLLSGSGISLTVSSGADSIEIDNTGILSVASGAGINVATVSGTATVTNAGVRSLQSTTALPSGRSTGAGINISGTTGDNLRITNTGVITVTGGFGITVSIDSATGEYQVTNAAPAVNSFSIIQVDGDVANRLVADAVGDTLNITSGYAISISEDIGTDTLTIGVNPAHDIKGSVFGDDSSIIVNAIDRVVTASGGFIGNITGNVTGDVKGSLFGDDSTAIINGIDNTVTGTSVTAGAIRLTGGTISTTDSSGIAVTAATTFNTDVAFDSDIAVNGQVTIAGDLIINGTTTTINSVTLTVDDKNIELGSTVSPTDVTADGGGITLKGSTDKTFNYVNSTGLWTANIGVQATSFTGLAAAATTASTAASVGYIGLPQNATGSTTLTIADAGKHIYITSASQTITIPAASSVAYPIGTTITFIAGPSASSTSIAITSDTMYLAGTGTTGTRTLAAYGIATAVKVSGASSSGIWFINGSGLT